MELFWFFMQQFKVPILGLLIFGILLFLRIYVLPVRRPGPPQNNGSGENEPVEDQNQSGKYPE